MIYSVEDDQASATWLYALRQSGMRPRALPRGVFNKPWRSVPDLVLMDQMLPGVDGDTFLQMRADPRTAHVPVIMLTAKGSEMDKAQPGPRADDYLVKPFGEAGAVEPHPPSAPQHHKGRGARAGCRRHRNDLDRHTVHSDLTASHPDQQGV